MKAARSVRWKWRNRHAKWRARMGKGLEKSKIRSVQLTRIGMGLEQRIQEAGHQRLEGLQCQTEG